MKKMSKKAIVLALVACIVFGSAGVLFARVGSERIEVIYRNIGIRVRGANVHIPPGDEPFIYKGRAYVPLRLVASALGYPVRWDGANFTVLIDETPGDLALSQLRHFHITGDRFANITYDGGANIVMAGRRHHNGTKISYGGPLSLLYNLDAKYSRLTGLVGVDDITSRGFEFLNVSFFGDDRLLHSVALQAAQPNPTPVEIDVKGVLVLRIEITGRLGLYRENINLADMFLKR